MRNVNFRLDNNFACLRIKLVIVFPISLNFSSLHKMKTSFFCVLGTLKLTYFKSLIKYL